MTLLSLLLNLYCAILLSIITYYCWKRLGLWRRPQPLISKKKVVSGPPEKEEELPEGEIVSGMEHEMEEIESDSESVEEREWREEQHSMRRMGVQ